MSLKSSIFLTFFNRIFRPIFSHYTKNFMDALIAEFSDMILKKVSFQQELSNLKSFPATYQKSGIIFLTPYETYCSDAIVIMFHLHTVNLSILLCAQKSIWRYFLSFETILKPQISEQFPPFNLQVLFLFYNPDKI